MRAERLGTRYGIGCYRAVFSPGRPLPICPRCWSRPNIDAKENDVFHEVREIQVGNARRTVHEGLYRCSNEACRTMIQVAMTLSFSPPYLPDHVLRGQLEGAEADRYLSGAHTRSGVWKETAEEVVAEVAMPVTPSRTPPEPAAEKPAKKRSARGEKAQKSKSQSKKSKPKTARKKAAV